MGILAILASCLVFVHSGTADTTAQFWAMNVGNYWVNNGSNPTDGTWTQRKDIVSVDTTTIPGVTTYYMETRYGGTLKEKGWFSINSTEFRLWRIDSSDDGVSWESTIFDGGVRLIRNPIVVGDSWTDSTTGTVAGSPVNISAQLSVDSQPTITVPLGSYKAYQIHRIITIPELGGVVDDSLSWVVPYVGMVKDQYYYGGADVDTDVLSSMNLIGLPAPVRLYDDFSEAHIDINKWQEGELVREIDTVNQRLVLKQASPNPVLISAYSYSNNNNLNFSDPNSVNSIQADVGIVDHTIINSAYTRARLTGRWYNDGAGTPSTDMTGDVGAEISLRGGPTGLYARWNVYRFTTADGSTTTSLGYQDFTTPITLGTTYTLYISYDSGINKFTFRVGSEERTFGPSGLPTRVRNANSPWKALNNRIQIDDDTSSCYLAATFDNVFKNGSSYDDFSLSTINATKWTSYEIVNEVSAGKFRSVSRSEGSSVLHNQHFLHPETIRGIKAKVTPITYNNPGGASVRSRLAGIFYNDTGNPSSGFTGDIWAEISLGWTSSSLTANWYVGRYTDSEGNNVTQLELGSFPITITLGVAYDLYIYWDGSAFTFKCNDTEANYAPTTSIFPPNNPTKSIGTRIATSGSSAFVESKFDDVMVDVPLDLVDFNADGNPDLLWRHKTLGYDVVWYLDGVNYTGSAFLPTMADADWEIAGVADFNGDGNPDLLWRHKTLGYDVVWYLDGMNYTGAAFLPTMADADWEIAGVADFNRDGRPDILWRHKTLGYDAVWYLDGVTYTGFAFLPTITDADWQIVGP